MSWPAGSARKRKRAQTPAADPSARPGTGANRDVLPGKELQGHGEGKRLEMPGSGHSDRPCGNITKQGWRILAQTPLATRIEHLRSKYPQMEHPHRFWRRNTMTTTLTPVFQACPPRSPELTGSSYAADLHRAIQNEVATSQGALDFFRGPTPPLQ